jgi:DNA polymerase III epsilon subunit-like protein
MNQDFFRKARANATTWARFLLARDPDSWVILDTETTGLSPHAEVVQYVSTTFRKRWWQMHRLSPMYSLGCGTQFATGCS